MIKRGGGVIDLIPRIIQSSSQKNNYIIVDVHINVCDSMGANITNTVCEKLSNKTCELIHGRIGLRILTNLCVHRRAIATFRIKTEIMGWKGVPGTTVAERVIEAYEMGVDDISRAVTNNKGIMNGIDAVALATGQDWRAIESAVHSYTVWER